MTLLGLHGRSASRSQSSICLVDSDVRYCGADCDDELEFRHDILLGINLENRIFKNAWRRTPMRSKTCDNIPDSIEEVMDVFLELEKL